MAPDIQKVIQIAHQAAQNILLPAFKEHTRASTKADGSIVTEADLKCQDFLQKQLALITPNIGFLGEEMSQDEQIQCLQSKQKFWCVDPLDGTSNFATPIPMFAISIALVDQGQPVLACIHDPIRHETFTAVKGHGFKLNNQKTTKNNINKLSQAVGFIDFKRLNKKTSTQLILDTPYRSQRNIGSCALEWAWLAAGRGQFIIHGQEKLWDYAAGCLLAEESGCTVSDFQGRHPFHKPQLNSPIAAAPTSLHKELLKNIAI